MEIWEDDGPEIKLFAEIEKAISASLNRDLPSGLALLDVLNWTVSQAIAAVVLNQREAVDAKFYIKDFATKLDGQVPLWIKKLRR